LGGAAAAVAFLVVQYTVGLPDISVEDQTQLLNNQTLFVTEALVILIFGAAVAWWSARSVLAFKDGSAITILQDIEVLAIDQDLAQVVSNDGEGGKTEERAVVSESAENPEATTATLAVWPNDAQKLTAGEEFTKGVKLTLSDALVAQFGLQDNAQVECEGSVRLALRHAGQQGPVKLEPHGVCASLFNTIWG